MLLRLRGASPAELGDSIVDRLMLPAVGWEQIERGAPRAQDFREPTAALVVFCRGRQTLQLIRKAEPAARGAGEQRRGYFRPAARTCDHPRRVYAGAPLVET